jgi:signal transduction histidine kinase/ActR/RegA family two-component response regulator
MASFATVENNSVEQLKQELAALKQRVAELEAVVVERNVAYDELSRHAQEQTIELIKINEILQHENAERQRTETELRQLNQQLLTIQAAGAALTSSLDLQYVLNTVTREMTNLLAVEACTISDWDQATDAVSTIAGYSQTTWWNNSYLGLVFHLADFPLTKKVLVEQCTQQLVLSQPDIDPAELALMQQGNTKSLLMLPMIFQERVIGLVEITDSQVERRFSDQEIALARLLSNQAAGAIENARLYQAERARHNEAEALHRAALALTSIMDLDQVFDHILAELQQVVPYDSASVQLLKGDYLEIIGERGFPTTVIGAKITIEGNTPNTLVLKTKKVLIIGEEAIAHYPIFQQPPHIFANIHSWLGVPILMGDQVIGMLTLDKQQANFYTEAHAQMVSAYATHAAIAIKNARLYQQAQQEIVERKRVEAEAVISRDTLQRLIQQLPIGVNIFDPNGLCIDINEALMRIFDIKDREDRVGRFNLFEDPLSEAVGAQAAGRRALAGEVVHLPEVVFDFERFQGPFVPAIGPRVLSITFFPVRDQEGQIIQIVALNEDITQRKQAEQALKLERERSLQQERLAAVGQLAAGIAHDFNNILTTVIGFAELLQLEPGLSESARKDLQRIVHQGQRGARLIRQILDFSRQTVMARRPMDLAPFLKEAIKLLEHTIPENISLTLEIEPGEYMFNADAAQIQQILTNLAVNAWDAMPAGGVLSFKLTYLTVQPDAPRLHPGLQPGHWIVLSVADTGIGIAPEMLSHIFEPFFTTKEVNKGTGLGLAQVDGIVKQHEGQIFVESQVGQGTAFTIYFPPLPGAPPTPTGVIQSRIFAGNQELILVVEDNLYVLTVTQKLLEHLGYQVLTATNGRHALELYNQYGDKIALLLADVTMPEMGGLELFQIIHQRSPAIKAILMTGYPLEDDKEEGVNWLQKPLNVEQLAKIVSQTLHPDRTSLPGLQG